MTIFHELPTFKDGQHEVRHPDLIFSLITIEEK